MTLPSGNDVPGSDAETREESAYEGRADNPAPDTQAATRFRLKTAKAEQERATHTGARVSSRPS